MKIANAYLQAYTLTYMDTHAYIYAYVHAHLCTHTLMHTQMHTNWLEGKDVDLYFFIWPACNLVWNLSLMNCLATVGRERAQLFHFSKQETTKMMQQPSTCSKTITCTRCFRKHLLNSAASVGGNKTKPRPLRPRSRNMVLEWFIKEERDKGSGLDPATGKVAPWFHGELAYVWPPALLACPHPSSFRYGNCPWTGKFPRQWNWLSVVERKKIRGEKKSGYKTKTKNNSIKKKEHWIPVKQLKRVHTWLVLVLVA